MLASLVLYFLQPLLLHCFVISKPSYHSIISIACNYRSCDVTITPVEHMDELSDAALLITYERYSIDPNLLFEQSPLLVPFTPAAVEEMRSSFTQLYKLEFDRLINVYNYVHRKDSRLRSNDQMINKRQIYVAKLNHYDEEGSGQSGEKENNRIVGYIDIDNTFDSLALHGNPIPYVSDFIVAKPYRNRGIGAMMLKFAEHLCSCSYHIKSTSSTANRFTSASKATSDIFRCLGLHLSVETKNDNALRFYMNFGFLPLFMERLQVLSNSNSGSSSGVSAVESNDACTIVRSPFSTNEIQNFVTSMHGYSDNNSDSDNDRDALVRTLESFPTFVEKSAQGYDRVLLKKVLLVSDS